MKRILNAFGLPIPKGGQGKYQQLKVALISDELTRSCLAHECQIRDVTPLNFKWLLKFWKPDLLFVESAWHGLGNSWKFKVAAYPDHAERNNFTLRKVLSYARNLHIPCVFWNKEDSVHFDRFIGSAKLFDTVFTVDENCLVHYRAILGPEAKVAPLMFAVQPAIHFPTSEMPNFRRACFVGSYSHHIHDSRRIWQDMMFQAASGLGVTVFDRNSSRNSSNYRYPEMSGMEVCKGVPHEATAQIYRDFLVSLNVNTVEDSGTMFSRRLIEIIACGSLAVTNTSVSVDRYFADYCEVVRDKEECDALFERLQKNGLSQNDRNRVMEGAHYVLREHTWAHRLEEILDAVK